jgi:hypothetical protein
MIKNPAARAEYWRNHSAHQARKHAYYIAHRDEIRKKSREQYLSHGAEIRARARRWSHANKEKVSANAKRYYQSHKDIIKARQSAKYYADLEGSRAYARQQVRELRNKPGVRERQNQWSRAWRKANPTSSLSSAMKHKYGITLERYNEILQKQGGVCAICGGLNAHPHRWGGVTTRLTIDHCHSTGRVRGLLCGACNVAIGMLKDNPTLVQAALVYLNSHNA